MTNYELYRRSTARHPSPDAFRTLLLILATVVIGLIISAAVPDSVTAELKAPQAYDLPNWHGNVAAQGVSR